MFVSFLGIVLFFSFYGIVSFVLFYGPFGKIGTTGIIVSLLTLLEELVVFTYG